jgi:FkbM family methyltransferase
MALAKKCKQKLGNIYNRLRKTASLWASDCGAPPANLDGLQRNLEQFIEQRLKYYFRMRQPFYLDPSIQKLMTHTVDDQRVFLDTHDPHITIHVLETGLWEEFTRHAIQTLLRPGQTFLDVGANVGLISLYASLINGPTGKLYCFEAMPNTFRILKDNIELNGLLGRAVLEQKAVYSHNAQIEFEYFASHAGMSGMKVSDERVKLFDSQIEKIQVDAVALDNYFSPGTKIDLMKVDVEGFEYNVVLGAQRLIRENPHIKILMEYLCNDMKQALGPDVVAKLLAFFQAEGFKVYELKADSFMPLEYGAYLTDYHGCDVLFSRDPV